MLRQDHLRAMLWGLSSPHLGTERCFPLSKPFQSIFHILSANSQTLIISATIGLLCTYHLLRTLLVTMSMDATAAAPASASALSIEGLEKVVMPVFESISRAAAKNDVLGESVFDKISGLLRLVGKHAWADRPRTYTILRLTNRVDAMSFFVHNGFLDIQLPYSDCRLPAELTRESRQLFLEKQAVVLTGANELELETGRHRHLKVDGDTFFSIVDYLGAGKFGRVDHVRSKLSLEEYARKKIARARTFSGDKAAMRMFENEPTNLKRLRHHHLVTFVGSYTDPRYIGMLTTPVAECDLQQLLQSAPSNPSLLRQFFGCLCSAVQYLHSQKCRHKDIKPGNILVRKGTVFLTDFGTALDWSDRSGGTTGGTTGPFTPRFTAPEVFKCERRNESSDIWSLGCVYPDILVSFFPFSTI